MIGGIQFSPSPPGDQLTQAVTRFVDETLTPEISNIEAPIEQLAEDMKRAYDDNTLTPNQIHAEIIDVLDVVIEAVRKLSLGLLELIKSLLEWVKDALNEPIQIPLLTHLYENTLAPGSKLSLLNGVSLLAAIPVTIVYKLFVEKAPFEEGDRAPLPPLPPQAVGGTPKLAMADASSRYALMAEDPDMAEDATTGSSQKPSDHLKNWSYVSGWFYSCIGCLGAAIDGFEYFKITKVEAEASKMKKTLPDSVMEDLKKFKIIIRWLRAATRLLTLPCLAPLDKNAKIYGWQWAIFGFSAFFFVGDLVVNILGFEMDEDEKAKLLAILDAVGIVPTAILEIVIFGIEIHWKEDYSPLDPWWKAEQWLVSLAGSGLGVYCDLAEEPDPRLIGASVGLQINSELQNVGRVIYNLYEESLHDNS
jgi:hypothetical protein